MCLSSNQFCSVCWILTLIMKLMFGGYENCTGSHQGSSDFNPVSIEALKIVDADGWRKGRE